MSKKESEALYQLNMHINSSNLKLSKTITIMNIDDLKTIKEIIKKQSKRIKEKETLYQKALSDLVIAEKMVDEMAEYIVNGKNVVDNVCSTLYGCKEDVLGNYIHKKLVNLTKETFKNKVEEKLKGDNYENN